MNAWQLRLLFSLWGGYSSWFSSQFALDIILDSHPPSSFRKRGQRLSFRDIFFGGGYTSKNRSHAHIYTFNASGEGRSLYCMEYGTYSGLSIALAFVSGEAYAQETREADKFSPFFPSSAHNNISTRQLVRRKRSSSWAGELAWYGLAACFSPFSLSIQFQSLLKPVEMNIIRFTYHHHTTTTLLLLLP